jgi:hypothetical protein
VTVANSTFDFSLATGGARSVVQGASVTNSLTASLLSGTAQTVTFSFSGLPTGATTTSTPGSCLPGCSATINIQTGGSTPAGTSTITVTGKAGPLTRTATFALTVTGTPDMTPPSVPTKLSGSAPSSSQVTLSWRAATDNVGVAGYRVYRNGALVGSTAGLSYQDVGLSPNTTYLYAVSAYDAAGNESSRTGTVSVKTRR